MSALSAMRCSIYNSPGAAGQTFAPTYVVPLLADRDDYDADPVFNEDGSRMSVLVESDSSNDDLQRCISSRATTRRCGRVA